MLNWTRINILLVITIILNGCVGGCKSKNLKYDQISQETDASSESGTDAYQFYDDALRTYVDSSGYVDYSNLRQNPLKLNTFIDFLAKVSPENYPELFPTQNDFGLLKILFTNPEASERGFWIYEKDEHCTLEHT